MSDDVEDIELTKERIAYSVPDAGEAIGSVSERTMHRLINEGEIAICKVRGRTVIMAEELRRYMKAQQRSKATA